MGEFCVLVLRAEERLEGEAAFGQWSFGSFAKAEIHEGDDARPGQWWWGGFPPGAGSWRRGQLAAHWEGGERSQTRGERSQAAAAVCTQGNWMLESQGSQPLPRS